MNRKTTPRKRLGDTRYVFENYSEYIQHKNDFHYTLIQFEHSLAKLLASIHTLQSFNPKVKIEPA